MTNLVTIEDDLYRRLRTVWDASDETTGVALVFDNTEQSTAPPETGTVAWARASVQIDDDSQSAFGHGTVRMLTTGLLSVQVFVPVGKGLKQSKRIQQVILSAVRKHVTVNGVTFRGTQIVDAGTSGKWRQHNILAAFEASAVV